MSYQYSSTNRIGLGYNFSKTIWTELRIYGDTKFVDIKPELAFLYNVATKEQYDIYIGISGIIDNQVCLSVPIGLQFRPIESFKRFSIQIEFQPIMNFEFHDIISFQSSAGIRYTFGDE